MNDIYFILVIVVTYYLVTRSLAFIQHMNNEGFINIKKHVSNFNKMKRKSRLTFKKIYNEYIYPTIVKFKKSNK